MRQPSTMDTSISPSMGPGTKQSQPRVWQPWLAIAVAGVLVGAWWWLWGSCANPLVTSCWLAERGDRVQHFAGWLSIVGNPTLSPVTKGLSWPMPSSIVYTDSIPLLGLLMQPLGRWSPHSFQYFSLAHLAGMLVAAWGAATIARAQQLSRSGSLTLVLALALAPIGLVRALGHTGLATHGLVVWALAWLIQRHAGPWRWGALLFLSLGIHAYLTGMLLALWALAQVNAWLDGSRRQACWNLATMPISLALGYSLFGYGVPAEPASTTRIWNANLLALMDPQGKSGWFGAFPIPMPLQWEGFAYLGIPLLLALVVLAPKRFARPEEQPLFPHPPLFWGLIIAMALFALGPEIWLGPWRLLSLRSTPIESLLNPVYGLFRSTGRFVWPLYDALVIWGVCRFDQRLRKPWLMALFAGAMLVETQGPSLAVMHAKARRFEGIGEHYRQNHALAIQLIQHLQAQGITHLINATGDPQTTFAALPPFALALLAPTIQTNHAPYLARDPKGFNRLYQGRSSGAILASVQQHLPRGAKALFILRHRDLSSFSTSWTLVPVADLDASTGLYRVIRSPLKGVGHTRIGG